MKSSSKEYRKYLSELTQELESSPPDRASAIAYDVGLIFIASGYGKAAYEVFSCLLEGQPRLSPSSLLMPSLKDIIFPNLCYVLDVDCLPLGLDRQCLDEFVRDREGKCRQIILLDRYRVDIQVPQNILPLIPRDLLQRKIEAIAPEYLQEVLSPRERKFQQFEILELLKNIYRTIQVLCKIHHFDEAIDLIEKYKTICEIHNIAPTDYISKDIQIIAIDTYFQLEENAKAIDWLSLWWESDGETSSLGFFTLISYRTVMRAFLDGALRDKLGISDKKVSDFLEVFRNYSDTPENSMSQFVPSVSNWTELIETWQDMLLSKLQLEEYAVFFGLSPEELVHKNRSRRGATEEEIRGLERRLGKSLPPSYRNFLLSCNGRTILADIPIEFLNTEEIDWFYNLNAEWVDIWTDSADDEMSDEDYFQYGEHQDCCQFRSQYLKTALQISTDCDGYVYLLNPEVIDERGEWEAWDFGNKYPGAYRYRSFWDMMQAIYKTAQAAIE
ncbi:SMI1/KNR4 family protein [Baaleninema simplex]|uniref:SMI1/KNR4 family protein n=1 Tax=Baaleninema simplex TaxID=2862350 RepID=UPI00036AFD0E|nr:SMI1/KNR4 family protein [Baaleninema simplex]